jgi:hypothetical protein
MGLVSQWKIMNSSVQVELLETRFMHLGRFQYFLFHL